MKSVLFAGLAALVVAGAAQAQENATVSVNAGATVRTFDDRLAGINTATWDNSTLVDAQSNSVAQQIDSRLMRFPGGSSSDAYHWATNSNDGTTYQGVSYDTFETQLTQPNHIQTIITLNYGSGTASEAAGWVADAKSKGYNIKYWEIGNECYGSWENDTNTPAHDPVEYATRAIQYISAIKAADPTARVGVVLALGEDSYPSNDKPVINPVTSTQHSGWDAEVLATLAAAKVTPDFVIYHNYPQYGTVSDSVLMQNAGSNTQGWVVDGTTLQAELNDYLGSTAGAQVEMLNTENNSVSSDPGKQSTSLVNGLYMADSFGYISESAFNAYIWWGLYNGPILPSDTNADFSSSLYGWRQYGDYGIVETTSNSNISSGLLYFPTYYVAKILSHFARGGDQIVTSSSSLSSLLDVFAAKRADGSLSLLIVNKSIPTTQVPAGLPVTASFTLAGFSPAANATQYQYGIPQDTQAQTDTTNNVDPGADAAADVQQTTVAISGTSFSMTFPAASVTLLSIPASQQPTGTARLLNLSSNGFVGTLNGSNRILDAGFYIGGSGSETVLIRGVGPTLKNFGVSSAATNVQIQVYDSSGNPIAGDYNNGWDSGTAQNTAALNAAFSQTGAFQLNSGSLDSALLLTLASGKTYTVEVSGVNGASGTALAEIYEVSAQGTRLSNISCQGYVDNAGHALTDGLTIGGSGVEQVLIRGVGPTLAAFGETTEVVDPTMKVFTQSGTVISTSDDWNDSSRSGLSAAFSSVGAFALNPMSRDAAVELTLPSAQYTAEVYATDGQPGNALVEVYEVPAP